MIFEKDFVIINILQYLDSEYAWLTKDDFIIYCCLKLNYKVSKINNFMCSHKLIDFISNKNDIDFLKHVYKTLNFDIILNNPYTKNTVLASPISLLHSIINNNYELLVFLVEKLKLKSIKQVENDKNIKQYLCNLNIFDDNSIFLKALECSNCKILQYLYKMGLSFPEDIDQVKKVVVTASNLDALKFISKNNKLYINIDDFDDVINIYSNNIRSGNNIKIIKSKQFVDIFNNIMIEFNNKNIDLYSQQIKVRI